MSTVYLMNADMPCCHFQSREAKAARTRRERHPRKKKVWECSDPKCRMRILSVEKPVRKWGDGHWCSFKLVSGDKKKDSMGT